MNNQSLFWRYSFLGLLVSCVPLLIVFQVVRFQLDPQQVDRILKESVNSSHEWKVITPARGRIYDRWGNLLAGNSLVYEVGIELREVSDPQTVALTLSTVLGLSYSEIFTIASTKPSENAIQVTVANNVSAEKLSQLEMILDEIYKSSSGGLTLPNANGIITSTHLARIYPEKTLGSNILGFVSREGLGYYGVEGYYNDLLAGKPKVVQVSLNPNLVQEQPVVPDGASLILTIDRAVQESMEAIIDSAVADSGSQAGTLVVMNPKTGEVMAIATTPRMDLNKFWEVKEIYPGETPFNRGVSQSYEPGSVFKVLTMASALDSGAVTPNTTFLDTGYIEVGGATIHNWDMGAWGMQDMQGCMQHSLNVCLAWVATQMGEDTFYRYLQAFGIGHLTGVDLAGENTGRIKVPGDTDWYASELGTNAFGQGVSATPIQMATAISAIANQGKMMAPHVVRTVIDGNNRFNIEQHVLGMPVKAETAVALTEMLARSLEVESSLALVTGYRVAGKTGTAEIPTPLGYTTNATNASFVGWGPVDDPQFLVYVWLERPTTAPWGSVVAAPVFRQAVEKLVILLNIPPDEIRHQLTKQ